MQYLETTQHNFFPDGDWCFQNWMITRCETEEFSITSAVWLCHSDQSTVCACQGSVHSNCQFFISCYIFFLLHTIKHVFVLHNSYERLYLFGPQNQVKTLRCNHMGLFFSTFVVKQHTAYLFTQVLLPIPMHTLAEAVDPITLMMWTAVEASHLFSAVDVAIVRLEYTTADQEMKLEWSVLVSVWFLYMCTRFQLLSSIFGCGKHMNDFITNICS